jgi:hypothetical protein
VTELKAAMDMYQAQYTATDKLWAYFSTVSLALVAYTISSDKVTRVFPEAVAAVVAYVTFCIGNFSALDASQRQLVSLSKIVQLQGKAYNLDPMSFPVFSSREVAKFYWLIVAVMVGASLFLAWYRGRKRAS